GNVAAASAFASCMSAALKFCSASAVLASCRAFTRACTSWRVAVGGGDGDGVGIGTGAGVGGVVGAGVVAGAGEGGMAGEIEGDGVATLEMSAWGGTYGLGIAFGIWLSTPRAIGGGSSARDAGEVSFVALAVSAGRC